MEMMNISEVSKLYDVTPRMLRYYEELELIKPTHKEDYSYRLYDEEAVRRLQQIILLRKLRISLKQIAEILKDKDQVKTLKIMCDKVAELDKEFYTLSTTKRILNVFIKRLDSSIRQQINLDVFNEQELAELVNVLTLSKNNLKENVSMSDFNSIGENNTKDCRIRLVLLPECTVAAYHYIGENPEEKVGNTMDKFVRESKLYEKKPDARLFGFNHPNPSPTNEVYGYEDYVTIPDDMEVPAPLVKKKMKGGLYAALTIDFPNFQEWELLTDWVNKNEIYTADYSELGEEIMGGCLEEHLNWVYASSMGWPENGIDGQLDLLLPIRKR